MRRCSEQACPLSKGRMIFLGLNYFLGYNLFYPLMMKNITLWLDPTARRIPDWMLWIVYGGMIIISIAVALPLLKESVQGLRFHGARILKTIGILLAFYYMTSIAMNLIIMLVTTSDTSANQSQIISAIEISPYLTFFSTAIYAPIVEEILFRGVFFRAFRPRFSLWTSALISACIFGFIHVMDSLFAGNFQDLVYILSYGCIGFFLALAYEKCDSIYGSMILHFLNNMIAFLIIVA